MSIRALVFVVLAGLSGLVCACSPGATGPGEGDAAPPKLTVGTEAAYPPFESVDPANGEIVGFDMDLVRALGRHLGRDVEVRNLPFDSLLLELDTGKLDLVCSGMSYTEERAQAVDFSAPYLRVPMSVLLGVERAGHVTGLDQLDDPAVVIAVQSGTTGALKAKARFPNATLRLFGTEDDAANELIVGRAHAFVYDVASVLRRHARNPDITRILDADLGTEDYCIAFPKGSPLRAEADAFLAANAAWIAERIDVWFPEDVRARLLR